MIKAYIAKHLWVKIKSIYDHCLQYIEQAIKIQESSLNEMCVHIVSAMVK